jgi:hypothetical protein
VWVKISGRSVGGLGRFLNPDNAAFKRTLNSKIYVDKTEFLDFTNQMINTNSAFICNSRPRRFGKSVTADMLTAYYSRGCDSKKLFSDLKIGSLENFEENLNKYNVIHFDVQWCLEPAGNPKKLVDYITRNTLNELREEFHEIISEEIESLPDALSKINAKTGKQFIIIIDEWDVLIRDEAAQLDVQEEYINFLRGLFKGSEPMKYIGLAYITGILPIKKLKTQSALNNFDEYTMLDAGEIAKYIGFTQDEVKKLCVKYETDFEKVRHWYDGYLLGEYHIYNPKAVVSVVTKRTFRSYWSQTGSYEVIVPLISKNFDGLKTAIIEMISGDMVKIDTGTFQNDAVNFSNRDDVITFLIHLGYLAYDEKKQCAYIPNEEVRQELLKATRQKKWKEFIEFERQSDSLLDATLDMDEETVSAVIEKIHMQYTSAIRYNDENSLSSVLTIAYLSSMKYYFTPIREFPAGRGFADFVYLPKPEYINIYPALLIELKWNKNVKTALEQIKKNLCPESLLSYTGDVFIVGITYDKKDKTHKCKIEKDKK